MKKPKKHTNKFRVFTNWCLEIWGQVKDLPKWSLYSWVLSNQTIWDNGSKSKLVIRTTYINLWRLKWASKIWNLLPAPFSLDGMRIKSKNEATNIIRPHSVLTLRRSPIGVSLWKKVQQIPAGSQQLNTKLEKCENRSKWAGPACCNPHTAIILQGEPQDV